jgi:low affinity Fe/Cu permease
MAETWTERFARYATRWTGSTVAFTLAVGVVLVWIATGPLFGFSDTWQLVINTGTTIITFLMVFLIQRSQNKDSQALHLKLNELVAAVQGASNHLLNVEDAPESELATLHQYYGTLARLADTERDVQQSHSVDEAAGRHEAKSKSRKRRRAKRAAKRRQSKPSSEGPSG